MPAILPRKNLVKTPRDQLSTHASRSTAALRESPPSGCHDHPAEARVFPPSLERSLPAQAPINVPARACSSMRASSLQQQYNVNGDQRKHDPESVEDNIDSQLLKPAA